MTAKEIQAYYKTNLLGRKTVSSQSKYQAKRTEYNGHNYASRIEARRAFELDMLIKIGKVYFWIAQPKFFLVRGFNYVADFLVAGYDHKNLLTVWAEDTKGVETQRFRDSKRLWAAHGQLPLHVKMMKNERWNTTIITPEKLE